MAPVPGTGLSFQWKEDGEIEAGKIERYGYRDTVPLVKTNEVDSWRPAHSLGHSYLLRDTPSIRGEWGSGDKVDVWIELFFQGFVVQVERDASDNTQPVRVLKQKSWQYLWQDQRLSEWLKATQI